MTKTIIVGICGIVAGLIMSYALVFFINRVSPKKNMVILPIPFLSQRQVIGFLPYWLLSQASPDYSHYITTLTYFGLTLETDGKIETMSNPQEEEPGWLALKSGKVDPFLSAAHTNHVKLSLLVFSAGNTDIDEIISDPKKNADNLLSDVVPIMKKYNFSNLNIDIESTEQASDAARTNFTEFVKEVKNGLVAHNSGSLTLDVSPTDLIKKDLISVQDVVPYADTIVLMTYDYHYLGSSVTGSVAPLSGAGIIYEYDTQAALAKALDVMPAQEVVLGIPLYGYEWETVGSVPRSAVIPGTGITDSSRHVDEFLSRCATCSAQYDTTSQESYTIYHDSETGTYHQMFYPSARSTASKVTIARQLQLGGVALWALGYEGKSLLEPLKEYKY